jgi:hypothetical protein
MVLVWRWEAPDIVVKKAECKSMIMTTGELILGHNLVETWMDPAIMIFVVGLCHYRVTAIVLHLAALETLATGILMAAHLQGR